MLGEPTLHVLDPARHGGKGGAMAHDPLARGDEGGVDGWSARACRIKDVARTLFQGHGYVRFEYLNDVKLPVAQRCEILKHGPIGRAREAIGIDVLLAQIMLKAH